MFRTAGRSDAVLAASPLLIPGITQPYPGLSMRAILSQAEDLRRSWATKTLRCAQNGRKVAPFMNSPGYWRLPRAGVPKWKNGNLLPKVV